MTTRPVLKLKESCSRRVAQPTGLSHTHAPRPGMCTAHAHAHGRRVAQVVALSAIMATCWLYVRALNRGSVFDALLCSLAYT